MTYLIIAVTVVTSLAANSNWDQPGSLFSQLWLSPLAIASGDYYRLLSVTLVHSPTDIFHLLFNMYALWYAGQLVEKMYGPWRLLGLYVICGIAGGASSYAFGSIGGSVGASGAIFGLFGVVLIATRFHHAILDAQSRAIAGQVGLLIIINLFIGFSGFFNIDNFGHMGGLVAGLWLGMLIPPSQVQTLGSVWQSPRGSKSPAQALAIRAVGIVALLAVIGAVVAYGTSEWQQSPYYPQPVGVRAPAVVAAPSADQLLVTEVSD
jgi:membrane associated rhomboid family serine protease